MRNGEITDIQVAQGWSEETLLDLVLAFVEEHSSEEHLVKWLQLKADAENKASGDFEGSIWCDSNECDRASCHRCFPRKDCTEHAKCEDFTDDGDAYTEEQAKQQGRS